MIAMGATPHIYAASIGIQDSIFLMFLALIVFGPRRLPEIGRQIGKLMYEFRKVSNDFKFQMEEELRLSEEAERRKREEAERQQRQALAAQSAATETPAATATTSVETPAAAPAETVTEPVTEAPYPRIQPPSTGEPVAASRPGSVSTLPEEPAETTAAVQDRTPAANESAADENPAVTEHTAHNG